MKRPETPPENLVGIQGDSLQITNMSKKIKEQTKNSERKHPFIIVNGKQYPQRNYNPQMAKRGSYRSSSSMSNSRYVEVDSKANSQSADCYNTYYEFPAFPSNALFKHKTMMPKSYFPRTVQERLPTRSEFKKIFSPKKLSKTELMLTESSPNTPIEKNNQSPKFTQKKSRRNDVLESNFSMSCRQNNRSFRTTI